MLRINTKYVPLNKFWNEHRQKCGLLCMKTLPFPCPIGPLLNEICLGRSRTPNLLMNTSIDSATTSASVAADIHYGDQACKGTDDWVSAW